MPYTVSKDGSGDKPFCVYKADADGNPTGKTLGCHPTAEQAGAQIGAIEHNEARKSVVDVLKDLLAKLNPTPADVHEDKFEDMEAERTCPKCGAKFTGDECPKCGWKAGEEEKAEPAEKPTEKSEVDKGDPDFTMLVPIVKQDVAKQEIYSVVLEPYVRDAQGDWETPDEIEKACHVWMENWNAHNIRHKGEIHKGIRTIENYIAPADFTLGDQDVRKGSWVMGVHIVDPDVWQQVEKGELNGFSIEGYGRREKRAVKEVAKGGPGSGHFDHAGRPGEVGGSMPGEGGGGKSGEASSSGESPFRSMANEFVSRMSNEDKGFVLGLINEAGRADIKVLSAKEASKKIKQMAKRQRPKMSEQELDGVSRLVMALML